MLYDNQLDPSCAAFCWLKILTVNLSLSSQAEDCNAETSRDAASIKHQELQRTVCVCESERERVCVSLLETAPSTGDQGAQNNASLVTPWRTFPLAACRQ
jgi:hypothetical protein